VPPRMIRNKLGQDSARKNTTPKSRTGKGMTLPYGVETTNEQKHKGQRVGKKGG